MKNTMPMMLMCGNIVHISREEARELMFQTCFIIYEDTVYQRPMNNDGQWPPVGFPDVLLDWFWYKN